MNAIPSMAKMYPRDSRGNKTAHQHFRLAALNQAEEEPNKYLPCFTSVSMELFHIAIKATNSKHESDRTVFQKMKHGYRVDLRFAKTRWLIPNWMRSLRRVHLVKVLHQIDYL